MRRSRPSQSVRSATAVRGAFTGTLVPAIGAYVLLAAYRVKWTQASQGNDTIAFNGLPALTVKKNLAQALVNLAANDVPAGSTTDLIFDGTNLQIAMGPVPAATSPTIVDARAGNPLVDVVSTAVETRVYSKSVPGNTIPAQGILRLTFNGDVLNNSGAAATFALRSGLAVRPCSTPARCV